MQHFELPEPAPRLHAFLTRRHAVLSMARVDWNRVKPPNRLPVLLDLGNTPVQAVSGGGVHAVADFVGGIEYRVSIYRPDATDAARGFPINTDRYRLWEGFPSFLDLAQIVNRATTDLDANVSRYINDRVFLVKDRPATDHWLADYPTYVRLMVEEQTPE